MSTKPDYEAAIPAAENLIREIENHLRPRNLLYAIQDIVDAALGGNPVKWAVAALIAEGGETIWWCERHHQPSLRNWACPDLVSAVGRAVEDECRMVEKLVYGPIPVEETEKT